MEPNQQEQSSRIREYNDIDLATVLHKTGQALNRITKFIGKAVLNVIVLTLLFIRKSFWWLALGSVVGLGYGLYQSFTSGIKYVSVSTVKMNFESTRYLYNSIDYLNSAISRGKLSDLAKIFHISENEAASIINFEAAPVINDLVATEMYKEKIARYRRNDITRIDTFWVKMLKYENFKQKLTKYDYPIHDITVASTNPDIFPKLQQGISELISQNEVLKRNKELLQNAARMEDTVLENSLKELDTLSRAYSKRVLRGINEKESSVNTSLAVLERTLPKAPELDLYNTKLLLKDELFILRSKTAAEQDIMQVYAPFNPIGQQQDMYSQSYFRTALYGLLVAFAILLGIALYKALGKLKPGSFTNV